MAISHVIIWVPDAWQWAFEGAAKSLGEFLVVAGGILGGISGFAAALDNPPLKWMFSRGAREAARGGDFVKGASQSYQNWKLLYVLIGIVAGVIAGGILSFVVALLLAILAVLGALLGAAAKGALIGASAGLFSVLILSAGVFVHALVRNPWLSTGVAIVTVALVGFAVSRSNILNEGFSTASVASPSHLFSPLPESRIERVWVEYNVSEANQDGFRIHVAARVAHRQGVACGAAAYFYNKGGRPLMDSDGRYRSADGQVSVGVDFAPGFDITVFDDLAMFLPYDQLHVKPLDSHDLQLQVRLYQKNGNFFASSEFRDFWLPVL